MQLDPPNIGEIIRRLDEITARQERMLDKMDRDRTEAAKLYVRQDVYLAERQMANAVVSDLQTDISGVSSKVETDRKEREQQRKEEAVARRQIWLALGGISVTLLLGIAGLIIQVVR
jgi:CHASE3 domain sensor protein